MDDLLSTQTEIPDSPSRLLPRERLSLPDPLPPVTLVCAPAGYGKTTVLADWARSLPEPALWLSLDDADNDPLRFMQHFIAVIRRRYPDFSADSADALANSQPPSIAQWMRMLINPLCRLPQRLVLVLDDLHLIHEPTVHEALAFLLEHRPPRLHLLLGTRREPPFSLARLRGRGQLRELRPDDLRFTSDECARFCNELMRLALPPALLDTLAERTEGWIVGLQLAALSLQQTADKPDFIRQFAGDDRHITDFLLEEVLRRRTPEQQEFLLDTAILERFTAPLCQAVSGRADSRDLLDLLEQDNLFLVSLDHRRHWYRFHHLFTSLLRSRLQTRHPERVQELHRRAADWFAGQGLYHEAIMHAIEAGALPLAAGLMEAHSGDIFTRGHFVTALGWAWRLPPELLAEHPRLSMTCAWGGLAMDNLPESRRHIAAALNGLAGFDRAPPGSHERGLWGQLALIRGCSHCLAGDLDAATAAMQEALDSLQPGRVLHQAACVGMAFCHYARGELARARQLFQPCTRLPETPHNLLVPLLATLGLVRTHFREGHASLARRTAEQALALLERQGWQDLPTVGMLHLALGELALARDDTGEAEARLRKGVDMTAAACMQYVHAWGQVLLAEVRVRQGQADGGLSPGQESLLALYSGRYVVEIPPVSAALGRLWLSQDRSDCLLQWLEDTGLSPLTVTQPEREEEYRVMARVLLRLKRPDEALSLLNALRPVLPPEGREALAETDRLEAQARQDASARFIPAPAGAADTVAPPLSRKERLVARHLVRGASSQEIAERLYVSLSTIKTHTRNIYAKLGVNRRLQAVEQLLKMDLA